MRDRSDADVVRPPAENHPRVRQLTSVALALPFAKPMARRVTKFALRKSPISIKNKERLYNLLGADASSIYPATCQVPVPSCGKLSLELDLTDHLNGTTGLNSHYERGTVSIFSRLLNNVDTVFDVGANIGMYTLLAALVFKVAARFTHLSQIRPCSIGYLVM